jgi:SAM-dependent methyltransferase
VASNFNARDAAVYEKSMGRWSRKLAPGLVAFAGLGDAVLDVGCGTGSLLTEILRSPTPRRVVGVDAASVYLEAARAQLRDKRLELLEGDAEALPVESRQFDAALSQLVLQFVSRPGVAVIEMARVVRRGGIVAASVWNSGGGMPHQRMFWDTAALLDPDAARLRAKTFNRETTRPGELARLFGGAGLGEIAETTLTIAMDFIGFDDFWAPIAGGEGTLGKYASALPDPAAARLRDALRHAYLAGAPDGRRVFHCTAFACRGRVPG